MGRNQTSVELLFLNDPTASSHPPSAEKLIDFSPAGSLDRTLSKQSRSQKNKNIDKRSSRSFDETADFSCETATTIVVITK